MFLIKALGVVNKLLFFDTCDIALDESIYLFVPDFINPLFLPVTPTGRP